MRDRTNKQWEKITVLMLCISALAQLSFANTRLIRYLDILDAWKYNYNASHWLEQGNLTTNAFMYGDVSIALTSVPKNLLGADWIQTAYGSKNFKGETIATFQLTGDAEVYIIHTASLTTKPLWLQAYKTTGLHVTNTESSNFDLLVKQFHKGDTVRLGSNGSTDLPMYIVVVKPVGTPPPLPQPQGKVFDVVQYGAIGDNKTINTKAIQLAIDDCAAKGGGSVYIHDGIFITGTLELKDNTTLFVQAGSILRGSVNHDDYPEFKTTFPGIYNDANLQLIYAENRKNVTIMGGGIIDGYGMGGGWPWQLKMDDPRRPRLLRMINCKQVLVSDVTMIRSNFWTQYFEACDSLREEYVRIRCYTGQHNVDGIDISGCKDVELKNYYAITGDDAVCIKNKSTKWTENLYIHDIQIRYSNCHAIKLGTETHSGVKNVLVKNVVAASRYGAAIESVDGAAVENIVYDNFYFSDCGVPIFIRLGQRGRPLANTTQPVPLSSMKNITVRNITNTGIGYIDTRDGPGVGSAISGIPGQEIENLLIENCNFLYYGSLKDTALVYRTVPENIKEYPEFNILGVCPAYGMYTRHVKNVVYKNIRIRSLNLDVRPAMVFDDVTGYKIEGLNCESFTITEPYPVWHKQKGKLSPDYATDQNK